MEKSRWKRGVFRCALITTLALVMSAGALFMAGCGDDGAVDGDVSESSSVSTDQPNIDALALNELNMKQYGGVSAPKVTLSEDGYTAAISAEGKEDGHFGVVFDDKDINSENEHTLTFDIKNNTSGGQNKISVGFAQVGSESVPRFLSIYGNYNVQTVFYRHNEREGADSTLIYQADRDSDGFVSIRVEIKGHVAEIYCRIEGEWTSMGKTDIESDGKVALVFGAKGNPADFTVRNVTLAEGVQLTDGVAPKPTCVGAEAKGKFYVYGETDKDALSYKVGEEMVFNFRLTDSGEEAAEYSCPKFVWTAAADDGQKWSGEADGSDGTLTLSFKMKSAGYVKVDVHACKQDGTAIAGVTSFMGGACSGFEAVTTGKEEPEDFWEFWQEQLRALDGVAPELIYKNEVASANSDFYTYDIAIKTHDKDAPATGYLTVPKNAEKGNTKIRLSFYGYNASFAPAPEYNNGYITLRINAHSFENGQSSSYYQGFKNGELKNYGFAASDYADPSGAYFRNMILRNVQAFRYLKSLEEWNGKDAILQGGSMGGFQATTVAALEPGASQLKVHIVWMCDVSGRSVGKLEGWLPEYTDNLRYFDTVYFAARVTCPTTITSAGLADYTATPCGVTAYYNALNCKKSLVFVQSADHSGSTIKKVTYSRNEEGT